MSELPEHVEEYHKLFVENSEQKTKSDELKAEVKRLQSQKDKLIKAYKEMQEQTLCEKANFENIRRQEIARMEEENTKLKVLEKSLSEKESKLVRQQAALDQKAAHLDEQARLLEEREAIVTDKETYQSALAEQQDLELLNIRQEKKQNSRDAKVNAEKLSVIEEQEKELARKRNKYQVEIEALKEKVKELDGQRIEVEKQIAVNEKESSRLTVLDTTLKSEEARLAVLWKNNVDKENSLKAMIVEIDAKLARLKKAS